MLEKLEVAYAGRFKLAKLNSDEQPEIAGQLSQAFGVRSIPFCVLFDGGQPVDGFVGALPEAQVRAFLDKHVPSAGELEAEAEIDEAEALIAEGDPEAALDKLQQAVAIDPANDDARFDYVKLLLERGQWAHAEQAFAPVASKAVADVRLDALGRWLAAAPRRRRRAQRRGTGRGHRRQQARLRGPLRAGANALRRRPLHAGDGRAARDRDARQGLEPGSGAQDLCRDPDPDEQAGRQAGGRRAGQGHARSDRQGRAAPPPIRWSISTGAS